jgi:NADH dehydrogenase
MDGLDRSQRLVWLQAMCDDEGALLAGRRSLHYDTLVMAIGSLVNDFQTPGVRQHALLLNSVADARRLHKRLFAICLRFNEGVTGTKDIAVIGGGATGVELVAELHDALKAYERYASASEPMGVRITLIEASAQILGHLSEDVRAKVLGDLRDKGIRILTGRAVKEVMADGVRLADGEVLSAGLVVWAAGVKAPDWLSHLDGLPCNRLNQLLVTPTLQSTIDANVFAMGDCAACTPPGQDKPIPPLAQAAHQQAAYLARVLPKHIRGHQKLPPFTFHDHGSLISLGVRKAVGTLNGPVSGHRFFVNGFIARWSYRALYQGYLMALHGWVRSSLAALGNVLTHTVKSRVKLH